MISFIIPTKNEEKVIGKTLRCLAGYSGEKEIIVSDGKSTDHTVAIAKENGAEVFEYKGTARQTIAMGRNDGASMASGDFFVFLDADMFIKSPDEFFAATFARFTNDPELAALTVNIKVLPEYETAADRRVSAFMNWFYKFTNNTLKLAGAPGEFQMIRAAAFKKCHGYNPALAANEDNDMFRRLSEIGKTRFEPSLTAYHTGRRAHVVGWPKLLATWFMNAVFVIIFKRAASKEWKEIR